LFRASATVAVVFSTILLGLPPAAEAAREHGSQGVLELATGQVARTNATIRLGGPGLAQVGAWSALVADVGTKWTATWDAATHIPRRLYGEGTPAPGAVNDSGIAETFARAFLAKHIALLSPGASASDFILASNQERNGVRVVGFFQTHQGLRVVGGQVSFRFKNDRLVVIGSEALPHVKVDVTSARISPFAAPVVNSLKLCFCASREI